MAANAVFSKPQRVASDVLAIFILALGITVTYLQVSALAFMKKYASKWSQCWPLGSQTYCDYFDLEPRGLEFGVSRALLAAGAFAIAAGTLWLFVRIMIPSWLVENPRTEAQQVRIKQRWDLIVMALIALSALMTLVTFAHACVRQNASSTWHYTDEKSSWQRFTLEAWACQMSRILGDSWWRPTCTRARAGRWLMIPLLLCLLGLAAVAFIQWKRQQSQEQSDDSELKETNSSASSA